ncbi:MAG TPA: galactokinase family protein [Solirubrobacteraceae bacterium]|jgi:galactokinase
MASTRVTTAFAPGRVNLIGEHTDYNGGLAIPFAIASGVTVRATPVDGRRIEAVASDLQESDSFDLADIGPADGWRAFVRGTAAELQRAGRELSGASLEISGTVPRGAGLSSSAALAVALGLALCALAGELEPDRVELAKLCCLVEHAWVGAQTGLLDQLASLFGERCRAVVIDFRSLAIRSVPLELPGHRLVLLDSHESRANAASGYNERRAECAQASALLGLSSLREATLDEVNQLPPPLDNRVRHVIGENARVVEAVQALDRRDAVVLGHLLDASHESSRDLYEISTEAVEAARERLLQAGALGARLVGGGFGGNILGLMPPDAEGLPDAREVRAAAGAGVTVS